MIDAPLIASFSIVFVLAISFTAMAWRSYRKSKLESKRKSFDDAEVERRLVADGDTGKNEERLSSRHSFGRRWERILARVGWFPVSSEEKRYSCGREMGELGRKEFVGSVKGQDVPAVSSKGLVSDGVTSKPASKMINTFRRPTYIPPFECLGGYRYSDYGYGSAAMSPLPILASFASMNTHHYPLVIVEAEGKSICTSSPMASPLPSSGKASMESGDGFTPTSYNDFVRSSQDDMRAALPIPKDHPLCQHHPGDHNPSTCHLPKPTGERNLAAFQYEQESLVPKPLNSKNGIHAAAANGKRDEQVNANGERDTIAGEESLDSYRGRLRSRVVSAFVGPSRAQSRSRYSHFENPLRQHPVGGENDSSQPGAAEGQSQSPGSVTTVNSQTEEHNDPGYEWPLVSRRMSKRFSINRRPVAGGAQVAQEHAAVAPPCSIRLEDQATKTLKRTVHLSVSDAGEKFKFVVESPKNSPTSSQIDKPAVIASAQRLKIRPIGPPSLQIGRRAPSSRQQNYRHFSVCDGTWTGCSSTLERRSPGSPARWSVPEDTKVARLKRARED
jgi:hypothetical protein